jgi:protein arginine kinase activator
MVNQAKVGYRQGRAMHRCDQCDQPAVIHEIDTQSGVEVHLCKQHAIKAGYIIPETPPATELLSQFAAVKGGKPQLKRKTICEGCGMAFGRFRKSGLLGCPDCYTAFEKQLESMIEGAHAGASTHVGRTPNRSDEVVDLQRIRRKLVEELDQAVASEQYERAATLRDRLSGLDVKTAE